MRRALTRGSISVLVRNALPLFRTIGLVTLGVASTHAYSNGELPASSDPNAPELAIGVVVATGEEIPYDVIDGMAILEGDIILGTHEDVQANGIEPLNLPSQADADAQAECAADPERFCSLIISSERRKWPVGVPIAYTLGSGTTAASRENILNAIEDWESKTSIRFVVRTNQNDYIDFVGTGNGSTCSSSLGRVGGRQTIRYAGSGRGCMVHEIGHAIGLSHEQNRNDRDDFINIDFSNISGNAASQFRKATSSTDVGPYDFQSVMHYGATTFAADRSRPVLTAKASTGYTGRIGGVSVLSPTDVLGVESVYATGNPTPTPTPPTPTPPTPTPPTPTPPTPPSNGDPVVMFDNLVDGGNIPAITSYGDITVSASDADVGTNDGDGIRDVTLVIARDGRNLGTRTEQRSSYDFGLRLVAGRTYTLTAVARSTGAAGGTSTSTSVTVTAQ